MHISWHGQTCIKLQTKNMGQEAIILIDSYKPKKGNFPRSFSPDVALYSNGRKNSVTLSQDPFIIDTLGEFDLKKIVFYSFPVSKDSNIFKISTEGMTIVHLGKLNKNLSNTDIEKIMGPDILFIPVGNNKEYIDAKTAASLINILEPRIIFPIGHKCDTDPEVDPVSKFITEIGLKPENETSKIIIKKKDLPQDETRLIVLDKE